MESMQTETMRDAALDYLAKSAEVLTKLAQAPTCDILNVVGILVDTLRSGGKILAFGNGGSAADAHHFVGEIVGRFLCERDPMPAVCLAADSCSLTALGNDYGFEQVFSRGVMALGRPGDVAFGISTSGNSPNVLKALEVAREKGLHTIALTGPLPNKAAEIADCALAIDAPMTPMVQQAHITLIHLLCLLVERNMEFKEKI